MPKRPIDRRVARTRATLHDALLALISGKGYEGITVRDICERANISRSTFYTHYADKGDLILPRTSHAVSPWLAARA